MKHQYVSSGTSFDAERKAQADFFSGAMQIFCRLNIFRRSCRVDRLPDILF